MTITLTKPHTQVIWRSASPGTKTTSIPGSDMTNNGYTLDIKTTRNSGNIYNIVPTSGKIGGSATGIKFTDTKCNLFLRSDGANNDWIIRNLCCYNDGPNITERNSFAGPPGPTGRPGSSVVAHSVFADAGDLILLCVFAADPSSTQTVTSISGPTGAGVVWTQLYASQDSYQITQALLSQETSATFPAPLQVPTTGPYTVNTGFSSLAANSLTAVSYFSSGLTLTGTGGSPGPGQYQYNSGTGVLTFNTADAGAKIVALTQFTGLSPTFTTVNGNFEIWSGYVTTTVVNATLTVNLSGSADCCQIVGACFAGMRSSTPFDAGSVTVLKSLSAAPAAAPFSSMTINGTNSADLLIMFKGLVYSQSMSVADGKTLVNEFGDPIGPGPGVWKGSYVIAGASGTNIAMELVGLSAGSRSNLILGPPWTMREATAYSSIIFTVAILPL
jgi:hypothetical protein